MYEKPQEFDERKFLRTPDNYGFLTLDYTPLKKLDISATMIYTGPMLVPYFGPLVSDPEQGELRRSSSFCDLGLKAAYTVKLNGASLQFHAGVKNILNSYQTDFDTGIDRDPGYIYGPMLPRTIYAGITFGNLVGSLQ
jgi:outer membrane receptor for ferrienterochelin and colicins